MRRACCAARRVPIRTWPTLRTPPGRNESFARCSDRPRSRRQVARMAGPLPDAWDATLPPADNLIKEYVFGYAELMEAMAGALGWPALRTDRFVAVDAATPFPFQNCVVPLRPFGTDEVDDVVGEAEASFRARDGGPFLLWGGFPIPDLSRRGWGLMGHPPVMLRPVGGEAPPLPDGLEVSPVRTVEEL